MTRREADLACGQLRDVGALPTVAGRALVGAAAAALLLSACGSSSGQHAGASAASPGCEQVTAALSDGPDPGSDPVGYAEAQILPLGQVRTSDPALRAAIADLAGSYRQFFASDGKSKQAAGAVAKAAAEVNKLCPGAGAAA
jgi:hypothetical protein